MRKSLRDISWLVDEPTYRADSALSYSKLSQFFKNGAKALISNEKIDTPSLRFGSLVDCILTAPEEFDDRFYVADIDKFSDKIREMIEYIYQLNVGDDDDRGLSEINSIQLLQVLDEFNYQSGWKDKTRVDKLIELGSDYYTVLKYSTGKTVISPQEFSEAQQCVMTLKTHPFTYQIFECNEDEEIFYQLKFKTQVEGVPFRFMMDICKVNHKNKTILPIDLKTSGKSSEDFEKSFLDWCYWIQGGSYRFSLTYICEGDDYFDDFEILPFQFLVINKNDLNPLIWEMNSVEINDFIMNKYGLNWYSLLRDANWHLQNGKFDYSRRSYENKGVNPIQLKL
jgi:hypothetical protein